MALSFGFLVTQNSVCFSGRGPTAYQHTVRAGRRFRNQRVSAERRFTAVPSSVGHSHEDGTNTATSGLRRLVAIMWDKALAVSTNIRIPCLHASPSGRATIRLGETVAWRGKIHLMPKRPPSPSPTLPGRLGRLVYPERRRVGAPQTKTHRDMHKCRNMFLTFVCRGR